MTDYGELHRRFRAAPPRPLGLARVRGLLEERFRAYEIPLHTIPAQDYANDEEVDEARVRHLYTITHPEVIASLTAPEDLEHRVVEPDEVDEGWRALFGYDPALIAYSLLNVQQELGQRLTVVLEAGEDGQTFTGYKVYGLSTPLNTFLCARAGQGERTADPGDPDFQFYLECLDSEGLI